MSHPEGEALKESLSQGALLRGMKFIWGAGSTSWKQKWRSRESETGRSVALGGSEEPSEMHVSPPFVPWPLFPVI